MIRNKKTFKFTGLIIALFALGSYGINCGNTTLYSTDPNMEIRNTLLSLVAPPLAGCAQARDNYISNHLFSGGIRYIYNVFECDVEDWSNMGFTATINGDSLMAISDGDMVVSQLPYSGFGTNIEVTFTPTSPTGTLDIMAYGNSSFTDGTTTNNPMYRLNVGDSTQCRVYYRNRATGIMTPFDANYCENISIVVGETYTYCLDFDRGAGPSGGSYVFGDMLAAWPKACSRVTGGERDNMASVPFMQMSNLPYMNISQSTKVGFSATGVTLKSFRIGNSIYQSNQ